MPTKVRSGSAHSILLLLEHSWVSAKLQSAAVQLKGTLAGAPDPLAAVEVAGGCSVWLTLPFHLPPMQEAQHDTSCHNATPAGAAQLLLLTLGGPGPPASFSSAPRVATRDTANHHQVVQQLPHRSLEQGEDTSILQLTATSLLWPGGSRPHWHAELS